MALFETILGGVASSIASATLRVWFKDRTIAAEAGSKFVEILGQKITETVTKKRAEASFVDIQYRAAAGIESILKNEKEYIDPERFKLISNAAGAAIDSTTIDADLLVSNNLDREKLVEFFIKKTGAEGGNPALAGLGHGHRAFTEKEQALYRRTLTYASQLIIDLATSFPEIENTINKSILKRLDSVSERVFADKSRIFEKEEDAFESDYRSACAGNLDRLELFGVDLPESEKRYKLSIAYVSLRLKERERSVEEEEGISAEDAFSRYPRLLIRGPAGAGKTTLVHWLAVKCALQQLSGPLEGLNSFIPFVIKLRDFATSDLPEPKDFPRAVSRAIGGSVPNLWVENRLKQGRAIVLVDGVDEVAQDYRTRFWSWLEDLVGIYNNARYVVTSRPHTSNESSRSRLGFIEVGLQEMSRKDVQIFVERWHDSVSSDFQKDSERGKMRELGKEFLRRLRKSPAVARLTDTPLLCALLCALHRRKRKLLPESRTELYKACIEMFLRRDSDRGLPNLDYIKLDDAQKLSLLRNLAWWMICNRWSSVDPEEAAQRFEFASKRLRNIRKRDGIGERILSLFMERLGIIRTAESGMVNFPHRTFQEFLAAEAAVEEGSRGMLVANAPDDQWREVVILSCGMFSPRHAEDLVVSLLKSGEENCETREIVYTIALSCLNQIVTLPEGSTLETDVDNALDEICPPSDLEQSRKLAAAGDAIVPFLRFDPSFNDREIAASVRTLAFLGSESAYEALESYDKAASSEMKGYFQGSARYAASAPDFYNAAVKGLTTVVFRDWFRSVTILPELSKNLKELDAGYGILEDISSLRSCPEIVELSIERTHVSDISAISACRKIRRINMDLTPVVDLSPLAGLRFLKWLSCLNSGVLTVAALKTCINLRILNLQKTELKDLNGLQELHALEVLNVNHTPVCDLSPLSGLGNLSRLSLANSGVVDLTPVSTLTGLTEIEFSGTQVKSLKPLLDCKKLRGVFALNCGALGEEEEKTIDELRKRGVVLLSNRGGAHSI